MKGKIVIVDASTLIGLLRIKQLSLLEKLFGKIIIPKGVYDEVVVEQKEGSNIFKESTYFIIKDVEDRVSRDFLMSSFGKGEAEVLTLAKENNADLILLDEKKARKTARRAGFKVMGILGILVMSKNNGFIPSVKPFIEELNRQRFRLSEKVIKKTLKEARE